MTSSHSSYVGRFAPSPSGPLHFGSLLTALASYLDAKSQGGEWLLRIDDIDPPREMEGASDLILKQLESFGLLWDRKAIYQSSRLNRYQEYAEQLFQDGMAYYCSCSRKELAEFDIYPKFCSDKSLRPSDDESLALRIRTKAEEVAEFTDLIQGRQQTTTALGDFIIRRKDGLPSYMLACAMDDLEDGISHIIRGIDLLSSTFWQNYLQRIINSSSYSISQSDSRSFPLYGHLPVLTNNKKQKLSKQHHAKPLDEKYRTHYLFAALHTLGQEPDASLIDESVESLLKYAIEKWSLTNVPAVETVPVAQCLQVLNIDPSFALE